MRRILMVALTGLLSTTTAAGCAQSEPVRALAERATASPSVRPAPPSPSARPAPPPPVVAAPASEPEKVEPEESEPRRGAGRTVPEPEIFTLGRGDAQWSGTAEVEVDYYDYCDLSSLDRHYLGSERYRFAATFLAQPPQRDSDGYQDPNGWRFTFSSEHQSGEGAFFFTSAYYGTMQFGSGRDVLLIYWDLWYDPDTGEVWGTLTDSRRNEGLALNQLSSSQPVVACQPQHGWLPMMYPFNEGAEMLGRLDERGGEFRFEAQATNGTRDVTIQVSLTRDR